MAHTLAGNQPKAPGGNVVSAWSGVVGFLAPSLRTCLAGLDVTLVTRVEEVRLRLGRPLGLRLTDGEVFIDAEGGLLRQPGGGYLVTAMDLKRTVELLSQSSVYALEEEFRNGYLTLPGGHRVGFVGRAVVDGGRVKTLKNVSGLNIRLAREVRGCAAPVLPYIYPPGRELPLHSLLLSPPRCGKTTVLRDLVRSLSDGGPGGVGGLHVGLVDERSEVAGCYQGVPQLDVGLRTDVLDGCPKAQGLMMLLRSMGPQVVATDEVGRAEDVEALADALNAGVAVLATAHGAGLEELRRRPIMKRLLEAGVFERLVLLGRSPGPGRVEQVLDATSGRCLATGSAAGGSRLFA